jgi:2-amino-4-hydroxy-6-hydroxymethyldihydropteridine diphosphokinase
MSDWVTAYLGLGSNLGDRRRAIDEALERLRKCQAIDVTRTSEIKETRPLGGLPQPAYLNAVAEVRTTLPAEGLLGTLMAVEKTLGRERGVRWSPRTIDLDLLLFDDRVIQSDALIVPHPQMHLRWFVLDGLCELCPDRVHPLLKEPMHELARRLDGGNFTLDPKAPQLVSVAGLIGVGKTTLVNALAERLEAEVLLEPYDTNPFLPEVYAGRRELALDSQLYFLVNRAEQLDRTMLPKHRISLTDYVFEKELIYARRLLDAEQLRLYERIYQPFARHATTPVAVVFLQDAPRDCLERIHRRNRPYEQAITIDFLEALERSYRRLFADWTVCPVIRVPASRLTGYDPAVVAHLAVQIKAYVAAQPKGAPDREAAGAGS